MAPDETPDVARRALGTFLRRMRDRAEPIPGRARRRVAGLRREDVALAAGISVTWYTWLEQARPVRVSRRTMLGVARALRLSDTERAHLLRLATTASRPLRRVRLTTIVGDELRALVDRLAPHAAYAVNGRWDVLHVNAAATALLGDFAARPGVTDNVLTRLFLDPDWRERFDDVPGVAAAAVAQFRVATAHMAADPEWVTFIARLTAASDAFGACWAQHDLALGGTWEKAIRHPTAGALQMRYASLAPDSAPADMRVIVYMPADAVTAARLATIA